MKKQLNPYSVKKLCQKKSPPSGDGRDFSQILLFDYFLAGAAAVSAAAAARVV